MRGYSDMKTVRLIVVVCRWHWKSRPVRCIFYTFYCTRNNSQKKQQNMRRENPFSKRLGGLVDRFSDRSFLSPLETVLLLWHAASCNWRAERRISHWLVVGSVYCTLLDASGLPPNQLFGLFSCIYALYRDVCAEYVESQDTRRVLSYLYLCSIKCQMEYLLHKVQASLFKPIYMAYPKRWALGVETYCGNSSRSLSAYKRLQVGQTSLL